VARFSQDTKLSALARAPLFYGLSKKELAQLARMTEDVEVEAGKVLCKEGKLGREFFVIVEGEADVRRRGRKIDTLGPGDFFGEIALVEKTHRTATVTAATRLRFFVLTSQSFWSLLDHAPEVERKVLRALARRVVASLETPA
jgi:CRP/FNR family cyclic AMP-dependent transcriptional regulator